MKNGKINIGVSACLIGLKYRYNGSSKMSQEMIDLLKDHVNFIPVCPEVECGLEIPRPPMRLEASAAGTRLRVIESGEDHTDLMRIWAETKLEQLAALQIQAFVFKSRSPSCGLCSVSLFNREGKCLRKTGGGYFSRMLRKRFPDLLVGEEGDFPEFAGKLLEK